MEASQLDSLQAALPAVVSKRGNDLILEGTVLIRRPETGAGFLVFLNRQLGTEQKVGDLRQERYVIQRNQAFRFLV